MRSDLGSSLNNITICSECVVVFSGFLSKNEYNSGLAADRVYPMLDDKSTGHSEQNKKK